MGERIANKGNHYGLPGNPFGMINSTDKAIGLTEFDPDKETIVSEREHTIMFDTRDCVGINSLREAQITFSYVVASDGRIPPDRFKECLNSSGIIDKNKLINLVRKLDNEGIIKGFPRRDIYTPRVDGNKIKFQLPQPLMMLKSLEIINLIIPRDIINTTIYFPNFINDCLPRSENINYLIPDPSVPNSTWISPIPFERQMFYDYGSIKLGGVYWTPLYFWRSYTGPNSMPNPSTPPPIDLWNPPQNPSNTSNPWPFQPQPIRGQRVPTYRAKNGVVFSGYGLYDLEDFPPIQELRLNDGLIIEIPLRKIILKLIVPKDQWINGKSAQELIDISDVDDFNNNGIVNDPLSETGYGDYQRFIPGPGLRMDYQPNQPRIGKSVPIDLTVSTYDPITKVLGPMPVPFPSFRGNVWGPYGSPGDRFQTIGLQDTIEDLYLNGDLNNLEGNPILWTQWDPSIEPYSFEYFILASKKPNSPVRFINFETSSNPNIKNAMRVQMAGGFGSSYSYILPANDVGEIGERNIAGLPNTQYDGVIHRFNPYVWTELASSEPSNWNDSVPGPQKASLVNEGEYAGWPYKWKTLTPLDGNVWLPITGGGVGPNEIMNSSEQWEKDPTQWTDSAVIGQSKIWKWPDTTNTGEIISNVTWGKVDAINPWSGGTDYANADDYDDFTEITYRIADPSDLTSSTYGQITVTSSDVETTKYNRIISFNTHDIPYADGTVTIAVVVPSIGETFLDETGNIINFPSGNNCIVRFKDFGDAPVLHYGGNNYTIQNNVPTRSIKGVGTGLTVDIISLINYGDDAIGVIDSLIINNPGSGYKEGDVIYVYQNGSNNNATYEITGASVITPDVIPEQNIWHYKDPRATGPNASLTNAAQQNDLLDSHCASDCPEKCTAISAPVIVKVGESGSTFADPTYDPRPTLGEYIDKCDFVDLESPDTEVNNDISENNYTSRPWDSNERIKRYNNYVDKRPAFQDFGHNNGTLINGLINYRTNFISLTPDTDLIIKVKEANREMTTQSLNYNVNGCNAIVPIRLSLGATTGTLEYVEATQGTLTSSSIYWKHRFHPPKEELREIEIELTSYDGTPINLERNLGFTSQINEWATILSTSIAKNYLNTDTSGNISGVNISTPTGILIGGSTSNRSLVDLFSDRLSQYTQRNLAIMLRGVCYHHENPGIKDVVHKMPIVDREEEQNPYGSENPNIIPLAKNMDQYWS